MWSKPMQTSPESSGCCCMKSQLAEFGLTLFHNEANWLDIVSAASERNGNHGTNGLGRVEKSPQSERCIKPCGPPETRAGAYRFLLDHPRPGGELVVADRVDVRPTRQVGRTALLCWRP